jgi:ferredoxin
MMLRKKHQISLALKFWRLTYWAKSLSRFSPFKQIAGLIVSDKVLRASFVPVGEEIEVPPGVVAPREILRDYIQRASHRTISYMCPCRSGEGCQNYPQDLGCILLGDAAKTVNPDVGYSATVDEALAYMDRALERGLLPMIGHVRIDRYVFGAKPFNRLMTLCFCCECCCVFRSGMRRLLTAYPDSMVRLEGVKVEITGECVGCGDCVPVCPVENVRLVGGTAEIGDRCLGCGSCARACEQGCISVTIEPGSRVHEELKRRIEAGVNIE